MKFLVPFAQIGGKHMILSTIQLLWITLISRLLQLLTSLARLLIITSLITLRALKVGIRTATQAMKTAAA